MAKPKAEPVEPVETEEPVAAPAETATENEAPDPEEFLAQVEARAHKGASEGFKTALDEWSKQVVEETDLDAVDAALKEKNGTQRPGGAGGPTAPGGAGRRAGASGSSIVQDAIALLVGRPRTPPA